MESGLLICDFGINPYWCSNSFRRSCYSGIHIGATFGDGSSNINWTCVRTQLTPTFVVALFENIVAPLVVAMSLITTFDGQDAISKPWSPGCLYWANTLYAWPLFATCMFLPLLECCLDILRRTQHVFLSGLSYYPSDYANLWPMVVLFVVSIPMISPRVWIIAYT